MGAADLCERYIEAVELADFEALDALFTPDAVVVSPLYGRLPAADFHRLLLADARTRLELRNLFDAANRAPSGAMHLRCVLTFAHEETVCFDAVDLFDVAPDGERFQSLTILYDSPATRAAYRALRSQQLAEAVGAAFGGERAA
jgi:hypothetical protein